MTKSVLIAGGSGLLGGLIATHLRAKRYQVNILTRNPQLESDIAWDPYLNKFPDEILEKTDIIINLSGANLNKKWTAEYKKELLKSRIAPTRLLFQKLKEHPKHRVKLFIQAAGISIYGDQGDSILAENHPAGDGFLEKLCVTWEKEAQKISDLGIKTDILRISPVLHPDNEFIRMQYKMARFNLLSPVGSGNQYVPWIHYKDFVRIIRFLIQLESKQGTTYNICSPNSNSQKDLILAFEKTVKKKQIMPAIPSQVIRWTMGEKSQLLTDSIHAQPKALMDAGFEFQFPDITQALKDIL